MSIFELQCPKCEKVTEVITKYEVYSTTKYVCDGCSLELNKIVSVGNFILNGGGWYSFNGGKRNPGVK